MHLRTTNPIESTFATVRHRTKVTKGPGSRAAGLAMAFKLIESAQDRWRAVNAPHLVALVRAGATFINGKLVTLWLVSLRGGQRRRRVGRVVKLARVGEVAHAAEVVQIVRCDAFPQVSRPLDGLPARQAVTQR